MTTTPKFKIIARGGPLNDNEDRICEYEVSGDALLDAYTVSNGELVEPPEDPPAGIKLYRRESASTYVWR